MKAIIWQAFDLSMDMYSYATFPRRPCLAFLDTTIHCMIVFVWLQMGVSSGVLTAFYFSAYSFFGGNDRGTRNERSVAKLGNEFFASVFFYFYFYYLFLKERLLFESIIR